MGYKVREETSYEEGDRVGGREGDVGKDDGDGEKKEIWIGKGDKDGVMRIRNRQAEERKERERNRNMEKVI